MRPGIRIPLLVAVAAHVGLFATVGVVRALVRAPDAGASAIAVRLLDEGAAAPPAPQRQHEVRPAWSPIESATPPARARATPPAPARAPAVAARPMPVPDARSEARARALAEAPALLPGPAAAHRPMTQLAAASLDVAETVGAGPGLALPPAGGPASPAGTAPAPAPRGGAGHATATQPHADAGGWAKGAPNSASLLTQCRPVYPRYCRINGQEGVVVLVVEVGADGKPGAVTVAESSGHTRLDNAAIEALRKASFAPATRGGKPVASMKRIAVAFRLRDADDGDESGEE